MNSDPILCWMSPCGNCSIITNNNIDFDFHCGSDFVATFKSPNNAIAYYIEEFEI